MKKTKIALSYPGLVVFDPEVIRTFIADHHIDTPNLLDAFVHDAALGQEAISTGCLLPIYSVQPWDYSVVLTEGATSSLPANWIRFQSPAFVLQVRSGRVIISDIWAIMNWDEEFYCNYEAYPLDPNYAAAEAQVSDSAELPNGRYQVVVVGFCEPGTSDLEQRQCGYELLLTPDADAAFGFVGSIDGIDFNVLPEAV